MDDNLSQFATDFATELNPSQFATDKFPSQIATDFATDYKVAICHGVVICHKL